MVDKSKKLPKRKRSRRDALLTEGEKLLLKEEDINSKSKSKLFRKLDRRFETLLKDLDIIQTSPQLEIWRQMKKYQFNSEFETISRKFDELSGGGFKRIYLDRIRDVKKDGKKFFWLEKHSGEQILDRTVTKKKPYYTERIFFPKNIFRGLKLGQKDEAVLMEAYRGGLLPTQKTNALDSKQLLTKIKRASLPQPKKVQKRCKTCGYVMSPKCPDCIKRSHERFEEMAKNIKLNEYAMTRKINLDN